MWITLLRAAVFQEWKNVSSKWKKKLPTKNDEQFRYLIIEDSFEIITIVYFGAVMNGYIYYNKYRVFGHCIVPKQPNNFPGNS